jgi:hypothetical protein
MVFPPEVAENPYPENAQHADYCNLVNNTISTKRAVINKEAF